MITKFYLHIRKNGAVRATKTKVAVNTDEITLEMQIELPNKLFIKPIISGKITVTDDMISPNVIEADIKEQIKEAIDSIKGVTLELIINEEE